MTFLFFLDCSIKNTKFKIRNRYKEDLKNKRINKKMIYPKNSQNVLNFFQELTLPLINGL